METRPAGALSALMFLLLGVLLLLGGCAHGGGGYSTAQTPAYAPTHYYPPPGPPDDPWGPYITEAAARFQIPAQWIRAVMQQESGGEEQAVSDVGAMGLMQLMPQTYQDLQSQYGLGADPFDPQNNILAGAAYIQQMYQRYGAPGFLAAYNAGPEDVDEYLAGDGPLPDETVNYLADVTPNLGTQVAFSGPFANNAAAGSLQQPAPDAADFASGCNPNAAYDPAHPCAAAAQTGVVQGQPAIVASALAGSCDSDTAYDPDAPCSSSGGCDIDQAYDPDSPCTPAQPMQAQAVPVASPDCGSSAVFNPACPASVLASVAQAPALQPAAPAQFQPDQESGVGAWAIQVGAFTNAMLARSVAESARGEIANVAGNATVAIGQTTPFGGNVLYQARLIHLSKQVAVQACSALNRRQLPCVVVRPASA